jgi:hypothetical protein
VSVEAPSQSLIGLSAVDRARKVFMATMAVLGA